jgi:two-component system response regulator
MMAHKTLHVLLVEDDPGDAELTRAALSESKLALNLTVMEDGEKAMDYLRKLPPFAGATMPDVVILDLNLPRKDGREVLAEIKSDPALRKIPVVILTTSNADDDIAKSYAHGANCYVTKPMGFPEFAKVVHSIQDFWFTIVKLPTHEAP